MVLAVLALVVAAVDRAAGLAVDFAAVLVAAGSAAAGPAGVVFAAVDFVVDLAGRGVAGGACGVTAGWGTDVGSGPEAGLVDAMPH
ncbi:MAG TPA: hypothetical protein VGX23_11450 [Actinocrinis sp.]|nr:hypothetical protein [Actinocrinis sp.]